MSREFSLVLLGAGVLTAGYFVFREDIDLFAKEEQQSKQQVAGTHRTYHGPLVFIYGGGYSGGRTTSPATGGGVSRGGFGSMGAHAGS